MKPLLLLPAMLIASVLCAPALQAQQRLFRSFVRPQIVAPLASLTWAGADTTTPNLDIPHAEKSGTLAMGLSAILPGAGQVYAERYYTIPIIWGVGGYFVSQWAKMDKRYQDYRGRYSQSVASDSISHTGSSFLKSLRDQYHDLRDEYAIYIGLTYILNIVDAYVGASLYGFDVSDDLGNARLQLRIPLR
jgi:hypothetical protein